MITLESTVDEVDTDTLQTKLNARNSLQVSEYIYNLKYKTDYIYLYGFYLDCKTIEN